jgi:hypothetical protein
MADRPTRGVTVVSVTALHRAVLMSLGFICAALLLGGPFGVIPAEAALLAEARHWRDDGAVRPGSFGRVWRGAVEAWRSALPGGAVLLAVGLAFWIASRQAASLPMALAIAAGLWLLLLAQHTALLLSFNRPAWLGWSAFLMTAWLSLAGILLWLLVAATLLLPLLPLTLALGPAVVALALVAVERPAASLLEPSRRGGI